MSYILLSLAALFWGANYVIGFVLVESIDPIMLTEIRWVLTSFLLLAIYHRSLFLNWSKIQSCFRTVVFLSFCGQVLFPLTLYISLQYTTALNAALYIASSPSIILLINKFVFKNKITSNHILGVFLSSVGVVYLLVEGNVTQFNVLKNLNRGDVWAMVSALSWAFYVAYLPKKKKDIDDNAFVTISSIIAAIILLPLTVLYLIFTPVIKFQSYENVRLWVELLYLVIFPSWLAYLFWNRGIVDMGATRGQIYTHLIPLVGGGLSIIFFQTHLQLYHWISAIFVIAGIYLCSRKKSLSNDL